MYLQNDIMSAGLIWLRIQINCRLCVK